MAEEGKQKWDLPWSAPTRWLAWLIATMLMMGAMLYLFYYYPGGEIGTEQPVPFSHRVHAGVKRIDCLFCHPYAPLGQKAGLPEMQKCFFCHNYVIPLHPQIEKERRHYQSGNAVRWVRVFYLPDFVKFRHHPHIAWAGLTCDTCHGWVQRMDRLPKKKFQMGFCIECHRSMGAQLACWLSCHR